jgi:hypothetical protein
MHSVTVRGSSNILERLWHEHGTLVARGPTLPVDFLERSLLGNFLVAGTTWLDFAVTINVT